MLKIELYFHAFSVVFAQHLYSYILVKNLSFYRLSLFIATASFSMYIM